MPGRGEAQHKGAKAANCAERRLKITPVAVAGNKVKPCYVLKLDTMSLRFYRVSYKEATCRRR